MSEFGKMFGFYAMRRKTRGGARRKKAALQGGLKKNEGK